MPLGQNVLSAGSVLRAAGDVKERFAGRLDVGAAAGHVRGDRHVADHFAVGVLVRLAGQRDDLGLALVVLGIEHFMIDAVLALEQRREHLALFHAGGADEHGPAGIAETP